MTFVHLKCFVSDVVENTRMGFYGNVLSCTKELAKGRIRWVFEVVTTIIGEGEDL
jgi:hypothetical protein